MQKVSRLAFVALALTSATLSGCATYERAKTFTKDAVALPASEIAAPIAKRTDAGPADAAERAVERATARAIRSLVLALDHPISLTAPITIPAFAKMNPEIVSTNDFGALLAREVTDSLAADGYTPHGKTRLSTAPKTAATVHGSYTQYGKLLTVSLEIRDTVDKSVLAATSYSLPIDGALRKLLDK